jgi:hypothetical protein
VQPLPQEARHHWNRARVAHQTQRLLAQTGCQLGRRSLGRRRQRLVRRRVPEGKAQTFRQTPAARRSIRAGDGRAEQEVRGEQSSAQHRTGRVSGRYALLRQVDDQRREACELGLQQRASIQAFERLSILLAQTRERVAPLTGRELGWDERARQVLGEDQVRMNRVGRNRGVRCERSNSSIDGDQRCIRLGAERRLHRGQVLAARQTTERLSQGSGSRP